VTFAEVEVEVADEVDSLDENGTTYTAWVVVSYSIYVDSIFKLFHFP